MSDRKGIGLKGWLAGSMPSHSPKDTPDDEEESSRELISGLRVIDLAQFRVVGGIVRYDESARNLLKDVKQRIVASLSSHPYGRDNYLVWGPPGSGKSFFFQEVGRSLGEQVRYRELNLAQLTEHAFHDGLSELEKAETLCLCLIDEVDSKPSEPWPYESLLPFLEPSSANASRICFVLAGSSGSGIEEMKDGIVKRPKGKDLLSRIPSGNECVIPRLGVGDKVLVASTQFLRVARELGRQIDGIEKLALYYVALAPRLTSARQIRELAMRAVERIPLGEDRIKFDYLFNAGDSENKEFWIKAQPVRGSFVSVFVSVKDDQTPKIIVSERTSTEPRAIERPRFNKHRIAVLPFANISPTISDEYLANGMTEELISTISKIGGLQIIARTSVIRYKDGSKGAEEIGRELGVGTLLEGSVRRAGEKLRITAQLIDSQTSEELWSETYDRDLRDVFAVQSDVARKVAGALEVHLRPAEKKLIEREPTRSQEAHSYYLRGLNYFNEYTAEAWMNALKYFELAAATDPSYVNAYIGIFAVYFGAVIGGLRSFNEVQSKLEAAASKAISLDENSAQAHLANASIRTWKLDWSGAEAELRKSVELDPSYALAHQQHSIILLTLRRRREALEEMKRYAELDPVSPLANAQVGWLLYENGMFDESITQLKKAVTMDPYFHPSRMIAGFAFLAASRCDEAIAEFQEAINLTEGKDLRYLGYLGTAYAKCGKLDEAGQMLEKLKQKSDERPISDLIAEVYLAIGDLDQTFLWAEKAVSEKNPAFLGGLNYDHDWDRVRSHPRFAALLKKAGHSSHRTELN